MSSTAQVCQELPGCSFWDFSLPSYKPVLLSEAWHSQTGAIPETYGYLELQSLKEPGKPICPICSSLDEETRTQKTALISLMPPNSLGEWGLPRRGEDVTCVIMCEPCKWCGSGITNPMDGLENRGSKMLSYFRKAAQLLSVKVGIGTQVSFNSKLMLHGLDSVCAGIWGESHILGHCT